MNLKNPKLLIGAGAAALVVVIALVAVVLMVTKKDSKSSTPSAVVTEFVDANLNINDPEFGTALAKVNRVTTNYDKGQIKNSSKIPSTVKFVRVDVTMFNTGKSFDVNATDYYLLKKGSDTKIRTTAYAQDKDLDKPLKTKEYTDSLSHTGSLYFDLTEDVKYSDLSFGYEPAVNLGKVSNMKIDLSTATVDDGKAGKNVDVVAPTGVLKHSSILYKKQAADIKVTKITKNYVPEDASKAADEGTEYLKLDLMITNTGSEKLSSYFFPSVISNSGVKVSESSYVLLGNFTDEPEVEVGQSATVTLYFNIVKGSKEVKLQLSKDQVLPLY